MRGMVDTGTCLDVRLLGCIHLILTALMSGRVSLRSRWPPAFLATPGVHRPHVVLRAIAWVCAIPLGVCPWSTLAVLTSPRLLGPPDALCEVVLPHSGPLLTTAQPF